jgi:hypothetical protein
VTTQLTDELRLVLKEILARRCADVEVFSPQDVFRELTRIERERVVDALSAELCETGIRSDGEPTARGAMIDRLISYFVPYDRPMCREPKKAAG